MDIWKWCYSLTQKGQKFAKDKTPRTYEQIRYITDLVEKYPITPDGPKGISDHLKILETTDGLLIAWERKGIIHHYLAPDNETILERGVENWPRGRTQILDQLSRVQDAEFSGPRTYSKALGTFMATQPIAKERERMERKAAKRTKKSKRKKKKA